MKKIIKVNKKHKHKGDLIDLCEYCGSGESVCDCGKLLFSDDSGKTWELA